MKGCYLLHFAPAYKHAKHYLGFAEDIYQRVEEHKRGSGARLTQVAVENGCTLYLVRIWQDQDRTFERKLKRRKNGPKLCPVCNQKHIDIDFEALDELAF